MKKILMFALIAVFITGFVFAQNQGTGVIRDLSGEVELKHSGSANFVKASSGDTVRLNTIISTGFRSTATVMVGSSTITVRPLTRLTLAEIQSAEKSESVNVNLQTGRVRVEVKPPTGTKANFSVQSPSSTASVRGTIFETDGFNYTAEEGIVDVRGVNNAPSAMLTGGLNTSMNLEGTANDPFVHTSAQSTIALVEGSQEVVTASSSSTMGTLVIEIVYEEN